MLRVAGRGAEPDVQFGRPQIDAGEAICPGLRHSWQIARDSDAVPALCAQSFGKVRRSNWA